MVVILKAVMRVSGLSDDITEIKSWRVDLTATLLSLHGHETSALPTPPRHISCWDTKGHLLQDTQEFPLSFCFHCFLGMGLHSCLGLPSAGSQTPFLTSGHRLPQDRARLRRYSTADLVVLSKIQT